MQSWIKSIHVNKLRQLQDFDIVICDDQAMRHLLVTGPNGSGKTTLLKSMLANLERIVADGNLCHLNFEQYFDQCLVAAREAAGRSDAVTEAQQKAMAKTWDTRIHQWWDELRLSLAGENLIAEQFTARKFVVSFYADERKSLFTAVKNPMKPEIKHSVKEKNGEQFLKFLVDLKVQQALARNEGEDGDAQEIQEWFDGFRDVLRQIFGDKTLEIEFEYRDYSFKIRAGGRAFPFTELSAGYAAVLDIVTDLILKMQDANRLVRVYDMPGIVLIDEVETHLHLALQKQIMPILTQVFPRVQFIVSTHSPFVLNSIKNATVYDLSRHEKLTDLTDYSYEALAEGFFGVETDSGELKRRLDRMEELIEKEALSASEKDELDEFLEDFEKIPNGVAPAQKLRFNDLKRKYLLKDRAQ